MRTRNQPDRQQKASPRTPTVVRGTRAQKSKGKNKLEVHSQSSDLDEPTPENKSEKIVKKAVSTNTSLREIISPHEMVDLEDSDESEWEDGIIPEFRSTDHQPNNLAREVVVEFEPTGPTPPSQKKPVRRASAQDKELAELTHKAHLLCLLARGRVVDEACNDSVLQGGLLSLLPEHLLKIANVPTLTANALAPLVNWFHENFHASVPSSQDRSIKSSLGIALENRRGTAEEVAALSVALFRALSLTARFVCILDVASLKPDADMSGWSSQGATRMESGIFNSSTLMVTRRRQVAVSPSQTSSRKLVFTDDITSESANGGTCRIKENIKAGQTTYFPTTHLSDKELKASASVVSPSIMSPNNPDTYLTKKAESSKRKGDLEFELQMEMAISASAAGVSDCNVILESKDFPSTSSNGSSLTSRFKRIKTVQSSEASQGISTAIGSRKAGPPLYWAEIFCNGELSTGKWVHVDAVNVIIDGADKVEAATAACKRSLRYVIAFSGQGAKDVTRRYCMKWYKIASKRINSQWWDEVLAPLTKLESSYNGGMVLPDAGNKQSSMARDATWNSLEDMELQTRALTEPLPTNQQAYRNHHLYAIEKWLTKYQMLYPKGPILGYCSGYPVYPVTCVKVLHTKQRWLREGLQIKENESPAKTVKRSLKHGKARPNTCEDDDSEGTFALYGKWQTEPLDLPHAENGIVPKNERGQVEVWSEKCLPHGTVHLRFPRMVPVARRLGIDFAIAMVGFEFRNGRSLPVHEGIVVCSEFKDAVMEAYMEVEERREGEEKKQNEAKAASRWYQLLSSIVTRQRLKDTYGDGSTSETPNHLNRKDDACGSHNTDHGDPMVTDDRQQSCRSDLTRFTESHEHTFPMEDQSFDEETSVRTKRCPCGFLVEMEEF